MHLLSGSAVLHEPVALGVAASTEPPEPPNRCFNPNEFGELPTCTWNGTSWERTFEGGALGGPAAAGVPGWFAAMAILVVVAGIGMMAWRISLARRIATQAGMDPNQATELVVLEDDGLEAAYLAGGLRDSGRQAGAPPSARTAEARLRELAKLRDDGLITAEEYDERRRAVLDSL